MEVYFVRNGSKIRVEVPENEQSTLMEAAKFHSPVPIPEIPADCGGSCACCTCHVHMLPEWINVTGAANDDNAELSLLEYEPNFDEKYSRLSCQIVLKKEHDGLVVIVP